MNRRHLILSAAATILLHAIPARAGAGDPDVPFDELLARYLIEAADGVNRVDYARWRASAADRRKLADYVATLAARRPSQMPRSEALAFWGNLYNAVTLTVILDNYPVDSIRNIRSEGVWLDPKAWTGPWRTPRVTVEGRRVSLDDIEHEIMRPTFRDPRIHYVVNCASIGCPNLWPRAWRAASLEADMDAAARAFVNHPRGAAVRADGSLWVSSIYRWFIEDFGGSDDGILAHLRRYAAPALAGAIDAGARIADHGYDWTLNRVTSGPGAS